MRMEELSDSRYIKGTDTVERYLLNLVQEYFKNANIASTTSREFIIKRAVERMKEEISYEGIGVLSITLPDGKMRTGAVNISLADLYGEPLISPKNAAFNVNFGNQENTACEGNDPRLSDKREPLDHQHEISDVIGLEGILSTLTGKIERVHDLTHSHDNQKVLDILVYTGAQETIDLRLLETLEGKMVKLIEEVHQHIIDYRQEVEDKVDEVNTEIERVVKEIDTIKQYILETNQEHYDLSKKYTDDKITEAQQAFNTEFAKYFTKEDLIKALAMANNIMTLAGTMRFNLKQYLNFTTSEEVTIAIDPTIMAELSARVQSLRDCQIEAFLEYQDENYKTVRTALPYVLFHDNAIDGSIQLSTKYGLNQIVLMFDSTSYVIPDEIKDASIVYNVYAKQNVTL